MIAESIYREALQQIASGEGYYGAQAKEYKDIAKAALRAAETLKKPVRGLDCGVDLRTGKWVCVCGLCSTAQRDVK
jgi:hypothetical protein